MIISIKKVKLTKSILNQLPPCTNAQILTAKSLGYIVNCHKRLKSCLLLEVGDGEYATLRHHKWEVLDDRRLVARGATPGGGDVTRSFATNNLRDDWLNQYNKLANVSQIFI